MSYLKETCGYIQLESNGIWINLGKIQPMAHGRLGPIRTISNRSSMFSPDDVFFRQGV